MDSLRLLGSSRLHWSSGSLSQSGQRPLPRAFALTTRSGKCAYTNPYIASRCEHNGLDTQTSLPAPPLQQSSAFQTCWRLCADSRGSIGNSAVSDLERGILLSWVSFLRGQPEVSPQTTQANGDLTDSSTAGRQFNNSIANTLPTEQDVLPLPTYRSSGSSLLATIRFSGSQGGLTPRTASSIDGLPESPL